MRFDVYVFGEIALRAATYDQLYTRITEHHRARTKACGFRISCGTRFVSPGDDVGYDSKYTIIDNHEEP